MFIVKIVPKQGLYNQKRNTMKRFPSMERYFQVSSYAKDWTFGIKLDGDRVTLRI
jgi:hypothetical protein